MIRRVGRGKAARGGARADALPGLTHRRPGQTHDGHPGQAVPARALRPARARPRCPPRRNPRWKPRPSVASRPQDVSEVLQTAGQALAVQDRPRPRRTVSGTGTAPESASHHIAAALSRAALRGPMASSAVPVLVVAAGLHLHDHHLGAVSDRRGRAHPEACVDSSPARGTLVPTRTRLPPVPRAASGRPIDEALCVRFRAASFDALVLTGLSGNTSEGTRHRRTRTLVAELGEDRHRRRRPETSRPPSARPCSTTTASTAATYPGGAP